MYVIAFFTNNGVPETGLTPTVKIINLATDAIVVDSVAMSHVDNGIYKYNFSSANSLVEYSIVCDGGATLSNVDRYKYGSDIVTTVNNTYGGAFYEQRTVVNTKDEEFKKEMKKILEELKDKIDIISKIDYESKFVKLDKTLSDNIKPVLGNLEKNSEDNKKVIISELTKLSKSSDKLNNELIKTIKQDLKLFNTNFSKLGDLINDNMDNSSKMQISKFSELKDQFNDKITLFENNFSNINNEIKLFKLINDEVGSAYIENKNKLDNVNKSLSDELDKLQQGVISYKDDLIEHNKNNLDSINKLNNLLSDKITDIETKFFNDAGISKLSNNENPNLYFMKKMYDTKILDLVSKMGNYMSDIKSLGDNELKNIGNDIDEISNKIIDLKKDNNKLIGSLNDYLPKLSNKKDLSSTIEVVDTSLKSMQDNNTKKIKDIKSKIEEINVNITNKFVEMNKKLKEIENDNFVSMQLNLINNEDERIKQDNN